ncbi:MAG: hypothetical protein Q9163_005896 [Psora crenata]
MSTSVQPRDDLKPVLTEIVRTGIRYPNIKLAVANIMIVSVGAATLISRNETFRLFLTDGEKTIQALVIRRKHRAILELSVRQGSILVLTDYQVAKGKRLSKEGNVVYLAISDFCLAGYNGRWDFGSAQKAGQTTIHAHSGSVPCLHSRKPDDGDKHQNAGWSEDTGAAVKYMDLKPEAISLPRCDEWIRHATLEHHRRCHMREDLTEVQQCPSVDDAHFWEFAEAHILRHIEPKCTSTSYLALRAMMVGAPLQPIRKPLKIIDLASVTGTNKSKNQTVDVLAVIDSIDLFTSKPARLPLKRDIRIIDRSVSQPVTLSVFVDPVNFRSTVGAIALFRNVTTHDYRRGNLNAYPVHCEGREWYIPNPRCIDLGEIKLDELEAWWVEQCNQPLMPEAV